MRKAKKVLLSILSAAFVGAAALGAVACGASVTKTTPVVKYYVGDNADMFDFIKYESGNDYSFTYKIDGGEEQTLEGESLYLGVEGEYEVTVLIGGKKADTFTFTVYNPVPYIMLKVDEITIPWDGYRLQQAVINMAAPKIISDVEFTTYVDSVLIYKDGEDAEPTKLEIEQGTPSGDGFWDGNRFHFIYECEHVFTIAAESSGGVATTELTVKVEEYLGDLEYLGEPIYNSQTKVATWEPVEGAANYRVKFGTVAYETADATQLSVDVDDFIKSEFAYFDLVIIPKDSEGEKLGKIVYEDVTISPAGNEGLVKGRGVTSIDPVNKQVTLLGGQAYTAGWSTGIHSTLNNSHIAFSGNYGLNTFVEFTYSGANMPNVAFFVDEINGDMSFKGGKGYILMNGLYSSSDARIIGSDRLVVVGPNRFSEGNDNYKGVSEKWPAGFTMAHDNLLTLKALEADTTARTYRYVVGAIDVGGKLAFKATLFVDGTDEIVAEGLYVTKQNAADAGYGKIVAYAAVKGNGNDTTFGYTLPYNLDTELAGGKINADGSIRLDGRKSDAADATAMAAIDSSYYAFKGNYGVGKYVSVGFKGNNMPQILFFADEINGALTSDGGKGLLITNGYGAANDKVVVFGPDRIRNSGAGATNNGYTDNVSKLYELANCALSKAKLDGETEYLLKAGTYAEEGYIVVDLQLYNKATEELIFENQTKTAVKVSDVSAGAILLYSALNGEQTPTVFTVEKTPYTKGMDVIKTFGATVNTDDSIVMSGVRPVHAGYGSGVGSPSGTQDSYIAWGDKEYGAGYRVEFYYTGNNMPYVMLFADSIDGYLGGNRKTDTGIVLMSGITSAGNTNVAANQYDHLVYGDVFTVWGPNRYKGYEAGNKTYLFAYGEYPALTQAALNETYKDTKFHYVVGSFVHPITGTVNIDIQLYTVAEDGTETKLYDFLINTGLALDKFTGRNIVAYAPMKGKGKDTTIEKVVIPYAYEKPLSEMGDVKVNAKQNADGSVTVSGGDDLAGLTYSGVTQGVGYGSGVSRYKNNYVGLVGGYGVGTYVATQFTGDNMPQVTLFAGEINEWIAIGHASYPDGAPVGQTGYLITNKITALDGTQKVYMNFPYCSGPNRISQNLTVPTASNFTTTAGAYAGLDENTTYTYIVGSYVKSEKVFIEIALYNAANGSVVYSGEMATGKTQAEAEALGGHIILFAGVKGCPNDAATRGTPYSTTFYYAKPFTAEPTYEQAKSALDALKA